MQASTGRKYPELRTIGSGDVDHGHDHDHDHEMKGGRQVVAG
jgi:hypothetical protein